MSRPAPDLRGIGRAVLSQVPAIDPGGSLARDDLVGLPPVCSAKGDADRVGQTQADGLGQVESHQELTAPQAAGVEAGLVGNARVVGSAEDAVGARGAGGHQAGAQRRVEGVAQPVIEGVLAVESHRGQRTTLKGCCGLRPRPE